MHIPTVHFSEVQHLLRNPVVLAILPASVLTTTVVLLGMAHKTGSVQVVWIWVAITLFEVVLFGGLRMRTTVTDREVRVSFAPLYWKRIPVEQIDSFEAVRYRPLEETGGWGVRSSRRYGRVVNVRGDDGVVLTAGKTRMLIGTQRPGELVAALAAAAGPR